MRTLPSLSKKVKRETDNIFVAEPKRIIMAHDQSGWAFVRVHEFLKIV